MLLCPDGNRLENVRTDAGLEISGNGKLPFSKTTVVLQSRSVLPTFARTPPPSTVVIGTPRFDQKLDELTAERKAARCAAEAMANLSVLPVSATSFPATVSGTVDSLQSVAVASTAEPEHRPSPLPANSSSSTQMPMEVEPCDVTDTSSASLVDKYSSYDRHFKKKFFGSERRPQSSEPIAKVGDTDHQTGDVGRDGSTPSPGVASSVACKKARLTEPNRNTISPLCMTVQTTVPLVSAALPPTTAVSAPTVSHESRLSSNPLPSEDVLHGSPSSMLTPTQASSASLLIGAASSSTSETPAELSRVEPCPAVTRSASDSGGSQPTGCLSGQIVNEHVPASKT